MPSKPRTKKKKPRGTLLRLDLFKPDSELQDFYDWANRTWFNYELPRVSVGYTKDPADNKNRYGSTVYIPGAKFAQYIFLNPFFKDWPEVERLTLLHEMIHVKYPDQAHHGRKFQKERRRLARIGAFDQHI